MLFILVLLYKVKLNLVRKGVNTQQDRKALSSVNNFFTGFPAIRQVNFGVTITIFNDIHLRELQND